MQADDEQVVDAVLLASRALVAIAARSLDAAPDDVTLPQYRLLVVLATRGPRRMADLAEDLGVQPSSATRLCDRLVRKKLIDRHAGAENRREVEVALTAAGEKLVGTVIAARRAELSTVVQGIPVDRRSMVADALAEFAAATGEVPEQAWSLGWTE